MDELKGPTREAPNPESVLRSPDNAEAVATGPETPLWTGRTSIKHYAGRIGLWFFGNIAAAILIAWYSGGSSGMTASHVFWIVLGLVVLSGLFLLLSPLLTIWGNRYRLTSERLVIERGILSQTIDQTELIRVDDVRIYKSVVDRMLGLGSVAVVSTDATDRELVIPGIAQSDQVSEAIRARMRAMRKKSLFVENL